MWLLQAQVNLHAQDAPSLYGHIQDKLECFLTSILVRKVIYCIHYPGNECKLHIGGSNMGKQGSSEINIVHWIYKDHTREKLFTLIKEKCNIWETEKMNLNPIPWLPAYSEHYSVLECYSCPTLRWACSSKIINQQRISPEENLDPWQTCKSEN